MKTENVAIENLKPHPRNYRGHPEDQLAHIIKSIQQHGIYRNVICASDLTILAGHGVVEACKKINIKEVPVLKLKIDPLSPQALKILTGDNEISRLGEIDDRALTEILKDIKDSDIEALLGTGYDEMMLANLLMITRPASEIANINEAAEYIGMPDYTEEGSKFAVMVHFLSEKERESFIELIKIKKIKKRSNFWVLWYPEKQNDDRGSVTFEG